MLVADAVMHSETFHTNPHANLKTVTLHERVVPIVFVTKKQHEKQRTVTANGDTADLAQLQTGFAATNRGCVCMHTGMNARFYSTALLPSAVL